MAIVISGFSSADKVPGAYGEVVYGAGGQTSATNPLILLLVGLQTAGNLTADTQVQPVYSLADIDYYAGAGSELACMGYDALATSQSVQIFMISPTLAGPTAATLTLTIAGAPTSGGYFILRIDGFPVVVNFTTADTATTIAAALSSAVNGSNSGRLPVSASNVAGAITLTTKTLSIRGNQRVVFVDSTGARSSGVTAVLSGGTAVTGGGMTFASGAGLETYTNTLATIVNRQFDRIALAANDAVSLAAWQTQVSTTEPAPTVSILEHAVYATNGTAAAAQTLASATLNAQRFQGLWSLNCETFPPRMAAAVAALRTVTEFNDPAASYDGQALPTVVAQSQQADWPSHATLFAALNNGVTPINTSGDGVARIVRSITTHCLSGSNPDYSTLDTAQAVCPDFVVTYFKNYWSNQFQKSNPRVQPDPGPNDPLPPSGIAYPLLWTSVVTKELRKMEASQVPGTSPGPILINVSANLPTSEYNPVAKRIMSAIPVVVAPGNHQIGISVRQIGQ